MNQKIEELRKRAAYVRAEFASDGDWVTALIDAVAWAARGQSLAGCESLRAQAYNGLVSDARAAIDRALSEPVSLEKNRAQETQPRPAQEAQEQPAPPAGGGDSGGNSRPGKGVRSKK